MFAKRVREKNKMMRNVRVTILNTDESYASELRTKLLKIDGVRIVAEVDEPALFASTVERFAPEVAFVHLDPDPDDMIALIKQVQAKYPGLQLFAISSKKDSNLILAAMRAGFREFLPKPLDADQLSDAVMRLVKTSPAPSRAGKLIAVLGPNGGCGATTLAVNLGCELAALSKRGAAVADLDFAFGHVAGMLDLSPQFTIGDLCHGFEAIDPVMVEKALIRHASGLMVLARPHRFGQAEHMSAANTVGALNSLCEMYDYVVCDGPTRFDGTAAAILDLADLAILVVNPVISSIRNATRIIEQLTRDGYNLERLRIAVNGYKTDPGAPDVKEIEKALGRPVDFVIPDEPKTVVPAGNMGQPLLAFAPKSIARNAIRRLANAIHEPDANSNPARRSSRRSALFSLFGKRNNKQENALKEVG